MAAHLEAALWYRLPFAVHARRSVRARPCGRPTPPGNARKRWHSLERWNEPRRSMELEQHLSYLENVRDWQSLVEELEKGIASSTANAVKAQLHLRLGRVLEGKFLAGVKALKHFQDAYKLNPALTESLESARSIYWDLGKLNMVQKLLELELKAGADGPNASALLLELGDVLCDLGEWEKATSTYARSLGASGGKNTEAR